MRTCAKSLQKKKKKEKKKIQAAQLQSASAVMKQMEWGNTHTHAHADTLTQPPNGGLLSTRYGKVWVFISAIKDSLNKKN